MVPQSDEGGPGELQGYKLQWASSVWRGQGRLPGGVAIELKSDGRLGVWGLPVDEGGGGGACVSKQVS